MLYDYYCEICNRKKEEYHGMTERPVILCYKCGNRCIKLISTGQLFCGVNGRADMYDFVDINTTGQPVVINSKTQWRNHLKKHGLNDDIKNDPLTKSDIENIQRQEVRKKECNRRKIREKVIDVVKNTPRSKLIERAKKVMKKGE